MQRRYTENALMTGEFVATDRRRIEPLGPSLTDWVLFEKRRL